MENVVLNLSTKDLRYLLPQSPYAINAPRGMDVADLNQLLNQLLGFAASHEAVSFDFSIRGELLADSLGVFIETRGISAVTQSRACHVSPHPRKSLTLLSFYCL